MSASSAERIGAGESTAPAQMYVINLAASTSPMALSHPSSPALKRFTFFVSRQREEGRERFRLHMGYFQTQEQAEELLPSVREVYPGAWAGPAPSTGTGRRERIAPGSVVPAVPPAVAVAPVPVAAPAAAVAPARVVAPTPTAAPAAAAAAKPAAPRPAAAPTIESMSNVRDVLAQLSEGASESASAATVIAPSPLRATPPVASASKATPMITPLAQVRELSNLDALSLLEESAPKIAPANPAVPPLKNPFEGFDKEPEVRLVTPEDTQTLTDIKVDRENNAPPCFAVQLVWSTTPVDVATLPHLAIFEAYTLYNVEGNRQGRRWYGLRLGFFSDPNSATQVANYVRSDYKTVAVVPVAVKERDRARGTTAPPPGGPEKTTDADLRREGMEGFELLADDRPPPPRRDLDDTVRARVPGKPVAPAVSPAVPPRLAPKAAPAAPAAAAPTPGKAVGKRVVARRRAPDVPLDRKVSAGVGGAEVLESTLEILGASTLSLDDGGRTIINDAAARKPEKKFGGNRFARLLGRLGGN